MGRVQLYEHAFSERRSMRAVRPSEFIYNPRSEPLVLRWQSRRATRGHRRCRASERLTARTRHYRSVWFRGRQDEGRGVLDISLGDGANRNKGYLDVTLALVNHLRLASSLINLEDPLLNLHDGRSWVRMPPGVVALRIFILNDSEPDIGRVGDYGRSRHANSDAK